MVALGMGCLLAGGKGPAAEHRLPSPSAERVQSLAASQSCSELEASIARWRADLPAGADHVLVGQASLADRSTGRVVFWAEATGLGADEPVEFFVIGPDSGHGYEALFRACALPSEIHRALEFIGLSAGQPFDPPGLRQWPKGSPVRVEVEWYETRPDAPPLLCSERLAMETLIADRCGSGDAMPRGFMFVGANMIDRRDGLAAQPVYQADVQEPMAIAATFARTTTVLHIVDGRNKSDSYGCLAPSPAYLNQTGQLVRIELKAAELGTEPAVMDRVLRIAPSLPAEGTKLHLELCTPAGETEADGGILAILAECRRQYQAGRRLYVALKPAPSVPIGTLQGLYAVLQQADEAGLVRIEPPAAGDLYYKAMLPPPSWRERDPSRPRPWELHLTGSGSDPPRWELIAVDSGRRTTRRHAIPSPARMERILADAPNPSPAFLVFAEPAISYGDLVEAVAPARGRHPWVHVFLGPPVSTGETP